MTTLHGFPRWNKPTKPAATTPQALAATAPPAPDIIEPPPEVPVDQISTASSPHDYDTEYDEDGRRLISTPLAPPPRPAPTILNPTPGSRMSPRPELRPTGGLLADHLAQRAADAEKSAGVRRERSAEIRDQPLPPSPRIPAPPVVMPADTPPAPVKSDAPAARPRPTGPPPRRVSMNDSLKFPVRRPANRPQQVSSARPQPLTADDIPFD
jgi:hypothetical protein